MIELNLGQDGSLQIKLEPGLSLALCSEFSKIYNKQFEPMQKWFDDVNVPQAEKDKYSETYTKALAEMNFLYQLFIRCGFSDEEIKEWMGIPF